MWDQDNFSVSLERRWIWSVRNFRSSFTKLIPKVEKSWWLPQLPAQAGSAPSACSLGLAMTSSKQLSPTPGLAGRWSFSCNPEARFHHVLVLIRQSCFCAARRVCPSTETSPARGLQGWWAAVQRLRKNFGHGCSTGMNWERAKIELFSLLSLCYSYRCEGGEVDGTEIFHSQPNQTQPLLASRCVS